MSYFTIEELCRSKTASIKGIDNKPSKEVEENLNKLISVVLNKVRSLWGAPIIVNSGYRSKELNKLIGGAVKSQHLTGNAADITAGNKEFNKMLFDLIVSSSIEFDQLIDEADYQWIHISYSKNPRGQVLHL